MGFSRFLTWSWIYAFIFIFLREKGAYGERTDPFVESTDFLDVQDMVITFSCSNEADFGSILWSGDSVTTRSCEEEETEEEGEDEPVEDVGGEAIPLPDSGGPEIGTPVEEPTEVIDKIFHCHFAEILKSDLDDSQYSYYPSCNYDGSDQGIQVDLDLPIPPTYSMREVDPSSPETTATIFINTPVEGVGATYTIHLNHCLGSEYTPSAETNGCTQNINTLEYKITENGKLGRFGKFVIPVSTAPRVDCYVNSSNQLHLKIRARKAIYGSFDGSGSHTYIHYRLDEGGSYGSWMSAGTNNLSTYAELKYQVVVHAPDEIPFVETGTCERAGTGGGGGSSSAPNAPTIFFGTDGSINVWCTGSTIIYWVSDGDIPAAADEVQMSSLTTEAFSFNTVTELESELGCNNEVYCLFEAQCRKSSVLSEFSSVKLIKLPKPEQTERKLVGKVEVDVKCIKGRLSWSRGTEFGEESTDSIKTFTFTSISDDDYWVKCENDGNAPSSSKYFERSSEWVTNTLKKASNPFASGSLVANGGGIQITATCTYGLPKATSSVTDYAATEAVPTLNWLITDTNAINDTDGTITISVLCQASSGFVESDSVTIKKTLPNASTPSLEVFTAGNDMKLRAVCTSGSDSAEIWNKNDVKKSIPATVPCGSADENNISFRGVCKRSFYKSQTMEFVAFQANAEPNCQFTDIFGGVRYECPTDDNPDCSLQTKSDTYFMAHNDEDFSRSDISKETRCFRSGFYCPVAKTFSKSLNFSGAFAVTVTGMTGGQQFRPKCTAIGEYQLELEVCFAGTNCLEYSLTHLSSHTVHHSDSREVAFDGTCVEKGKLGNNSVITKTVTKSTSPTVTCAPQFDQTFSCRGACSAGFIIACKFGDEESYSGVDRRTKRFISNSTYGCYCQKHGFLNSDVESESISLTYQGGEISFSETSVEGGKNVDVNCPYSIDTKKFILVTGSWIEVTTPVFVSETTEFGGGKCQTKGYYNKEVYDLITITVPIASDPVIEIVYKATSTTGFAASVTCGMGDALEYRLKDGTIKPVSDSNVLFAISAEKYVDYDENVVNVDARCKYSVGGTHSEWMTGTKTLDATPKPSLSPICVETGLKVTISCEAGSVYIEDSTQGAQTQIKGYTWGTNKTVKYNCKSAFHAFSADEVGLYMLTEPVAPTAGSTVEEIGGKKMSIICEAGTPEISIGDSGVFESQSVIDMTYDKDETTLKATTYKARCVSTSYGCYSTNSGFTVDNPTKTEDPTQTSEDVSGGLKFNFSCGGRLLILTLDGITNEYVGDTHVTITDDSSMTYIAYCGETGKRYSKITGTLTVSFTPNPTSGGCIASGEDFICSVACANDSHCKQELPGYSAASCSMTFARSSNEQLKPTGTGLSWKGSCDAGSGYLPSKFSYTETLKLQTLSKPLAVSEGIIGGIQISISCTIGDVEKKLGIGGSWSAYGGPVEIFETTDVYARCSSDGYETSEDDWTFSVSTLDKPTVNITPVPNGFEISITCGNGSPVQKLCDSVLSEESPQMVLQSSFSSLHPNLGCSYRGWCVKEGFANSVAHTTSLKLSKLSTPSLVETAQANGKRVTFSCNDELATPSCTPSVPSPITSEGLTTFACSCDRDGYLSTSVSKTVSVLKLSAPTSNCVGYLQGFQCTPSCPTGAATVEHFFFFGENDYSESAVLTCNLSEYESLAPEESGIYWSGRCKKDGYVTSDVQNELLKLQRMSEISLTEDDAIFGIDVTVNCPAVSSSASYKFYTDDYNPYTTKIQIRKEGDLHVKCHGDGFIDEVLSKTYDASYKSTPPSITCTPTYDAYTCYATCEAGGYYRVDEQSSASFSKSAAMNAVGTKFYASCVDVGKFMSDEKSDDVVLGICSNPDVDEENSSPAGKQVTITCSAENEACYELHGSGHCSGGNTHSYIVLESSVVKHKCRRLGFETASVSQTINVSVMEADPTVACVADWGGHTCTLTCSSAKAETIEYTVDGRTTIIPVTSFLDASVKTTVLVDFTTITSFDKIEGRCLKPGFTKGVWQHRTLAYKQLLSSHPILSAQKQSDGSQDVTINCAAGSEIFVDDSSGYGQSTVISSSVIATVLISCKQKGYGSSTKSFTFDVDKSAPPSSVVCTPTWTGYTCDITCDDGADAEWAYMSSAVTANKSSSVSFTFFHMSAMDPYIYGRCVKELKTPSVYVKSNEMLKCEVLEAPEIMENDRVPFGKKLQITCPETGDLIGTDFDGGDYTAEIERTVSGTFPYEYSCRMLGCSPLSTNGTIIVLQTQQPTITYTPEFNVHVFNIDCGSASALYKIENVLGETLGNTIRFNDFPNITDDGLSVEARCQKSGEGPSAFVAADNLIEKCETARDPTPYVQTTPKRIGSEATISCVEGDTLYFDGTSKNSHATTIELATVRTDTVEALCRREGCLDTSRSVSLGVRDTAPNPVLTCSEEYEGYICSIECGDVRGIAMAETSTYTENSYRLDVMVEVKDPPGTVVLQSRCVEPGKAATNWYSVTYNRCQIVESEWPIIEESNFDWGKNVTYSCNTDDTLFVNGTERLNGASDFIETSGDHTIEVSCKRKGCTSATKSVTISVIETAPPTITCTPEYDAIQCSIACDGTIAQYKFSNEIIIDGDSVDIHVASTPQPLHARCYQSGGTQTDWIEETIERCEIDGNWPSFERIDLPVGQRVTTSCAEGDLIFKNNVPEENGYNYFVVDDIYTTAAMFGINCKRKGCVADTLALVLGVEPATNPTISCSPEYDSYICNIECGDGGKVLYSKDNGSFYSAPSETNVANATISIFNDIPTNGSRQIYAKCQESGKAESTVTISESLPYCRIDETKWPSVTEEEATPGREVYYSCKSGRDLFIDGKFTNNDNVMFEISSGTLTSNVSCRYKGCISSTISCTTVPVKETTSPTIQCLDDYAAITCSINCSEGAIAEYKLSSALATIVKSSSVIIPIESTPVTVYGRCYQTGGTRTAFLEEANPRCDIDSKWPSLEYKDLPIGKEAILVCESGDVIVVDDVIQSDKFTTSFILDTSTTDTVEIACTRKGCMQSSMTLSKGVSMASDPSLLCSTVFGGFTCTAECDTDAIALVSKDGGDFKAGDDSSHITSINIIIEEHIAVDGFIEVSAKCQESGKALSNIVSSSKLQYCAVDTSIWPDFEVEDTLPGINVTISCEETDTLFVNGNRQVEVPTNEAFYTIKEGSETYDVACKRIGCQAALASFATTEVDVTSPPTVNCEPQLDNFICKVLCEDNTFTAQYTFMDDENTPIVYTIPLDANGIVTLTYADILELTNSLSVDKVPFYGRCMGIGSTVTGWIKVADSEEMKYCQNDSPVIDYNNLDCGREVTLTCSNVILFNGQTQVTLTCSNVMLINGQTQVSSSIVLSQTTIRTPSYSVMCKSIGCEASPESVIDLTVIGTSEPTFSITSDFEVFHVEAGCAEGFILSKWFGVGGDTDEKYEFSENTFDVERSVFGTKEFISLHLRCHLPGHACRTIGQVLEMRSDVIPAASAMDLPDEGRKITLTCSDDSEICIEPDKGCQGSKEYSEEFLATGAVTAYCRRKGYKNSSSQVYSVYVNKAATPNIVFTPSTPNTQTISITCAELKGFPEVVILNGNDQNVTFGKGDSATLSLNVSIDQLEGDKTIKALGTCRGSGLETVSGDNSFTLETLSEPIVTMIPVDEGIKVHMICNPLGATLDCSRSFTLLNEKNEGYLIVYSQQDVTLMAECSKNGFITSSKTITEGVPSAPMPSITVTSPLPNIQTSKVTCNYDPLDITTEVVAEMSIIAVKSNREIGSFDSGEDTNQTGIVVVSSPIDGSGLNEEVDGLEIKILGKCKAKGTRTSEFTRNITFLKAEVPKFEKKNELNALIVKMSCFSSDFSLHCDHEDFIINDDSKDKGMIELDGVTTPIDDILIKASCYKNGQITSGDSLIIKATDAPILDTVPHEGLKITTIICSDTAIAYLNEESSTSSNFQLSLTTTTSIIAFCREEGKLPFSEIYEVPVIQATDPLLTCEFDGIDTVCSSICSTEGSYSYIYSLLDDVFKQLPSLVLTNDHIERSKADGFYTFNSYCIGEGIAQSNTLFDKSIVDTIPLKPIITRESNDQGDMITIECPETDVQDTILWFSNGARDSPLQEGTSSTSMKEEFVFNDEISTVVKGECRRHGFISEIESEDIDLTTGVISFDDFSIIIDETDSVTPKSIILERIDGADTEICVELLVEWSNSNEENLPEWITSEIDQLNALEPICWSHHDATTKTVIFDVTGNSWFNGNYLIDFYIKPSTIRRPAVIGSIDDFTLQIIDNEILRKGEVKIVDSRTHHKIGTGKNSFQIQVSRNEGNSVASVELECVSSDPNIGSCNLEPSKLHWHPLDNDLTRNVTVSASFVADLDSSIEKSFISTVSIGKSDRVDIDLGSKSVKLTFEHTLPTLELSNRMFLESQDRVSIFKRDFEFLSSEAIKLYYVIILSETLELTLSSEEILARGSVLEAEMGKDELKQIMVNDAHQLSQDRGESPTARVSGRYFMFAIGYDEVNNPSEVVYHSWTIDTRFPTVTFTTTPLSSTSLQYANFEFDIYDQDSLVMEKELCSEVCSGGCSALCTLSTKQNVILAQSVNCSEGLFSRTNLPPQQLMLTIHTCDCLAPENCHDTEFEWEVTLNAIDLLKKDGDGFDVVDAKTNVFEVDELGNGITFSFGLPRSPAIGETLTISCSSHNLNEGLVSNGILRFTASNWESTPEMVVSGVPDLDNADIDTSFTVSCNMNSDGGGLNKVYSNIKATTLHFINHNVIHPMIGDIIYHKLLKAANDTAGTPAEYEEVPSMSSGDFSLTLSGGERLSLLADDTYNGLRFHENCSVQFASVQNPKNILDIDWEYVSENEISVFIPSIETDSPFMDEYLSFTISNPSEIIQIGEDDNGGEMVELKSIGNTITCPDICPGGTAPGVYVTQSCVSSDETEFQTGSACLDTSSDAYRNCGFGYGVGCQLCSDIHPNAICPGGKRIFGPESTWQPSSNVLPETCEPLYACGGWDISLDRSVCNTGYDGYMCGACADRFFRSDLGNCDACPETSTLELLLPIIAISTVGLMVFGIIFVILLLISRKNKGKITMKYCINKAFQFAVWVTLSLQVLVQVGKSAKGELPGFMESFYTAMNIFLLEPNFMPAACMSSVPFLIETTMMVTAIISTIVALIFDCSVRESTIEPPKKNSASKRSFVFAVLRGCYLALILMYPMYTNNALTLLNCKVIDGKWYLASDTKFQCFKDEMLIPDILSVITIIVCSLGFPLYSWRRNDSVLKEFKKNVENLEPGKTPVSMKNIRFDSDTNEFVLAEPVNTTETERKDSLNDLYDQYTPNETITFPTRDGPKVFYRLRKNAFFLSNDLLATKFYFRHLNCLLLFVMAVCITFVSNVFIISIIDLLMCLILAILFKKSNPYVPDDEWKRDVKLLSLFVVILASILNAVAYGYYTKGIAECALIVKILAPFVVFMAIMLFVVLLWSFWYHIAVKDIGLKFKRRKRQKLQEESVKQMNNNENIFRMNPLAMYPNRFDGTSKAGSQEVFKTDGVKSGSRRTQNPLLSRNSNVRKNVITKTRKIPTQQLQQHLQQQRRGRSRNSPASGSSGISRPTIIEIKKCHELAKKFSSRHLLRPNAQPRQIGIPFSQSNSTDSNAGFHNKNWKLQSPDRNSPNLLLPSSAGHSGFVGGTTTTGLHNNSAVTAKPKTKRYRPFVSDW